MFLELFQSVDGHMTNLKTTMGDQCVAEIVQSFDGSNLKEFKEWIKSIDKFGPLTRISNERVKYIAYQASTGPVSYFAKRYLEQHGDHTWDQIKGKLKMRFHEVVNFQHALLILRKIRQKTSGLFH